MGSGCRFVQHVDDEVGAAEFVVEIGMGGELLFGRRWLVERAESEACVQKCPDVAGERAVHVDEASAPPCPLAGSLVGVVVDRVEELSVRLLNPTCRAVNSAWGGCCRLRSDHRGAGRGMPPQWRCGSRAGQRERCTTRLCRSFRSQHH